jgi:hypothetical protein
MFISRTGILPPERGEFGADIFYLVLASNYMMGAPRVRSRAACRRCATLSLVDVSLRGELNTCCWRGRPISGEGEYSCSNASAVIRQYRSTVFQSDSLRDDLVLGYNVLLLELSSWQSAYCACKTCDFKLLAAARKFSFPRHAASAWHVWGVCRTIIV